MILPAGVTATAYEQALADIRGVPARVVSAESEQPQPSTDCCSGTRNGYQWHINHKVPPCAKSREANRVWHAEYELRRRKGVS